MTSKSGHFGSRSPIHSYGEKCVVCFDLRETGSANPSTYSRSFRTFCFNVFFVRVQRSGTSSGLNFEVEEEE